MEPRILVIRLSSLGDVVLTAPVYKNLKAHWPGCRISVLVKPQFAPVLERNPNVDEILVYRGFLDSLRLIRLSGFTHLLDLHATWRTLWLRRLARVPQVAAYRKDALARRLFVHLGLPSPSLTRHTLDRYLDALKAWGVPARTRDLSLGDYGPARNGSPPTPTHILLVQTSFLGDTLLTVPLARRIKETLPGCRLSVLTRPQTADLFRGSPWVDDILEDDKRDADSGLLGLIRLAARLRGRFDTALVAHRSLRSALLVWLARVPCRVGFSTSAGAFLFHRTVFFSWSMPEAERNMALLLPLRPDLRAEARDALYLEGRPASQDPLAEIGSSRRPLVGLHPGSAWPTKRWMADSYARLAARLTREAGCRVVLVGGPEDRALCEAIASGAGSEAVSMAGRTSLADLIALMGKLSLLVTNDSGPMHIAAARGVPTLAIFGPTTRELGFFPYGAGHRVLEKDLPCRPCGLHGSKECPEGHFLCMRLISVDEAFRAAVALLKVPTAA